MAMLDGIDLNDYSVDPPKPGACPICATVHDPAMPHNRNSLYYQMQFRRKYGRYPTWEDAMWHCDEQTKRIWRAKLSMRGVMPEGTMNDG